MERVKSEKISMSQDDVEQLVTKHLKFVEGLIGPLEFDWLPHSAAHNPGPGTMVRITSKHVVATGPLDKN